MSIDVEDLEEAMRRFCQCGGSRIVISTEGDATADFEGVAWKSKRDHQAQASEDTFVSTLIETLNAVADEWSHP